MCEAEACDVDSECDLRIRTDEGGPTLLVRGVLTIADAAITRVEAKRSSLLRFAMTAPVRHLNTDVDLPKQARQPGSSRRLEEPDSSVSP